MNTAIIKKFAQSARRVLLEQIDRKLERVLAPAGIYRREKEAAVKELEREIALSGREQTVKRAAYTWFNRICALRFMDVKGYTRVRVVSPSPNLSQPEILTEAKSGHIDEVLLPEPVRQKVLQLLSRQIPSENPEQEAFALLFISCCNYYHREMPFLFEKIQDYTELLLPDDLLSENSLLQMTISALDEANCEKVEVIGWLYQYYISERKDEVFADLKKNKKIQQADIPAATQLFTPEWIVRYMVENSLGRLWLQNFPASPLQNKMPYFIPDEPGSPIDAQFIKIASPEEIRFCDPACGSGHILVIAFDLLYQMYEEHGYDPNQIPALILQKNLVGLEIDERAAELAAFALSMKAREKDKRFFSRKDAAGNRIVPDIHTFQNVDFSEAELTAILATGISMAAKQMSQQNQKLETSPYWREISLLHEDIEREKLQKVEKESARLGQDDEKGQKALEKAQKTFARNRVLAPELFANFLDAIRFLTDVKNVIGLFGKEKIERQDRLKRVASENICRESFFSEFLRGLNRVKTYLGNLGELKSFGSLVMPVAEAHVIMDEYKKTLDRLLDSETCRKIDQAHRQYSYLGQQFHVVVANPPYMGGKGMNPSLSDFATNFYPDSKSDLFAMFIERNLEFAAENAMVAMITMQSWMFLSSFATMRSKIIDNFIISNMAHLGPRAFDSIGGEVVSTTSFVLSKTHNLAYRGAYIRLVDGRSEAEKASLLREVIKETAAGSAI